MFTEILLLELKKTLKACFIYLLLILLAVRWCSLSLPIPIPSYGIAAWKRWHNAPSLCADTDTAGVISLLFTMSLSAGLCQRFWKSTSWDHFSRPSVNFQYLGEGFRRFYCQPAHLTGSFWIWSWNCLPGPTIQAVQDRELSLPVLFLIIPNVLFVAYLLPSLRYTKMISTYLAGVVFSPLRIIGVISPMDNEVLKYWSIPSESMPHGVF